MKDFWQKLPNKGQPPNSGHWLMYQLVLYLEVPLYTHAVYFMPYCLVEGGPHDQLVYVRGLHNVFTAYLLPSLQCGFFC